jgi:hypothetical protein
MTEVQQKNYVYKMLRRFHTDKFIPKYRSRLAEITDDKRTEMYEKLDSFAAKAAELLRILRSDDNDGLLAGV